MDISIGLLIFIIFYEILFLGIVGTGRVGSAVIQSLIEQSEILGQRFGLNIKVRGIANSRKMILGINKQFYYYYYYY